MVASARVADQRAESARAHLVNRGDCPGRNYRDGTKVANIQTVSRLAGHSDVATTMKFYAAVTDDQIDAIRAANEQGMSAVCGRVPPQ